MSLTVLTVWDLSKRRRRRTAAVPGTKVIEGCRESESEIQQNSRSLLLLIGHHGVSINRRLIITPCRASIDSWLSQLYGSTTVVMAIYGLHWKWRSLTPCQRHPSEPIEKICGTIDYVIDLNNLAKFGFGKIFRDWGIYPTYKGLCFFKKLFTLLGTRTAQTAEPILMRNISNDAVWWEEVPFLC